jgi:hypothetical protein
MSEDRLARPRNEYEVVMEAEAAINRRLAALDAKTGRPLDQQQRAEIIAAQRRADAVFGALSLAAPAPKANEPAYPYRVRLAADLQRHHPQWRNTDLYPVARSQPSAFAIIENEIYRAATERGLDPEYRGHAPEGTLRERVATEEGLKIHYFHGDIRDCLKTLTGTHTLAVSSFGPRFAGRR